MHKNKNRHCKTNRYARYHENLICYLKKKKILEQSKNYIFEIPTRMIFTIKKSLYPINYYTYSTPSTRKCIYTQK